MIVYAVRMPYEGMVSIHATLEAATVALGDGGKYGDYIVAYNINTQEETEVD